MIRFRLSISLNPITPINITPLDTVCLGDTVSLTATANNITSSNWTTGAGTIFSPTQLTTDIAPTTDGYYFLDILDNNGCENSDSLLVITETAPAVSINASQDSICEGDNALLIATSLSSTFTWIQNGFVATPNNDSTIVTPTTTSDFSVIATSSNGCNSFDTISIFVDPIPAGVVSNDTTICLNDTITLTATGGVSYDWGTPYRANLLAPNQLQIFPDRDTTYSVKVFNSLGCYDSLSVSISLNPVTPINITPLDTVCLGDTVSLTATANNITSSNWTTGAGTIFTPTQLTTDIEPFTSEFYTLTILDINGCSNSDSTLVIVESSPNITIVASLDSICAGDSSLLVATGAATNITWFQNGFVSSPTNASTYVTPTTTTQFMVRGKTSDGCDALDSATIFVDPLPVVGLPNDTSLCINDTLILVAKGGTTYDWGTPYRANLLAPDSLQIFPDRDTLYT